VAASVGFGRLHLMPLVQSFLGKHPDVKIDLRLSDGFVDLVEQGVDLAVRIGELADSSLVARRVGTTKRLLVAHRSYLRAQPKARRRLASPQDLAPHNCIVYTELPMRNDWPFEAGPGARDPAGTMRTVRVEGNLQTNSSEVIRAAVLSGMGVAYAPAWLFTQELAAGEVQKLLPDWCAPEVPIQLVSPRGRGNSAKVRAFGDYVAKAWEPEFRPATAAR
jgi:DNA-binding transcriptional LysR family regulator